MTFAYMYKIYFDCIHLLCYPFLFSPPFFFPSTAPTVLIFLTLISPPEKPHVRENIKYPGTSFCP